MYLFLNNKEKLYPLQDANVLTDGIYLSYGEFMRIYLKTVDAPNGRGFRGTYKTSKKHLFLFFTSSFKILQEALDEIQNRYKYFLYVK